MKTQNPNRPYSKQTFRFKKNQDRSAEVNSETSFYQTVPLEEEKTISPVYKVIDNDLARDNLENDIPDADLQDL